MFRPKGPLPEIATGLFRVYKTTAC